MNEKFNYEYFNVENIKIFDYNIIKCKVPEFLYNKKELKEDIESLFNSKIILEQGYKTIEQVGNGYSTVSLGSEYVTNLKEVKPIINYISTSILNFFYHEENLEISKIIYPRMWINKIYKNCSGKCHRHDTRIDGVAIFYYKSPQFSSDLILLKNFIDGEVLEKHKNISHHIKVETGDLIIHPPDIPHAVSKHLADEPRICFVFDFFRKKNNFVNRFKYI